MNMKPLTIVFVMLLIPNIICWWEVGHMTVAQIAENQLKKTSPTAYTKFNSIITALNSLTDGRSNTFVQAAVWADDIKETGAKLFDNYHFLDRIYDPQGVLPQLTDVNKYINSLNTVGYCMSVLKKNINFTSFERTIMARFLLHLVGDIHQPLHSVNMFNNSKNIITNGDLGGNLLTIYTVKGEKYNLHAFLDSIAAIIQQTNVTLLQRPLNVSGFDYIRNFASEIETKYPKSSFGALTDVTDVNTWTIESYNEAVNTLYKFVEKTDRATAEWTTQVYQLCKKKIALAGYRLAHMISQIYA